VVVVLHAAAAVVVGGGAKAAAVGARVAVDLFFLFYENLFTES
jgi:hypothetical protein